MLSQHLAKRVRFAGLFLLLFCAQALGVGAKDEEYVSAISVYARISDNTFTEYGKNDFIYNQESGPTEHLGLAVYWQFDNDVFIEAGNERGKGTIDWKGVRQNFEYAELQTEYLLTESYVHLGRNFGGHSSYVGMGTRYRERNVIDGDIYEELRWIFATWGISNQFRLSQRWQLNFTGNLAISLDAQQKVEFGGQYDPVTVEPGQIATARGTVELELRVTPKFAISLGPTYEFSLINKGDPRILKINGVDRAVAHQPKTEFETIFWQLKLEKLF